MADATNGYQLLLLRSIQEDIRDLRQEIRSLRGIVIAYLSNTSTKSPDPIGEPWRLAERAANIIPTIWSAIQWIWHVVILMIPGVLAGWGLVEGWWSVVWRFIGAVPR